jgi:hypothetical protein
VNNEKLKEFFGLAQGKNSDLMKNRKWKQKLVN